MEIRTRKSVLCRALLLCGLAGAAHAGDEDMNPSIYQRFDPETGYMVPVDPPPQHNAPAKADAQEAGKPPAPATPGPAAEQTQSPAFWVAGIAGLLIIGGILWRRKRLGG